MTPYENKILAERFLLDCLGNQNLDIIDSIIHPDYRPQSQQTAQSQLMWSEEIRIVEGREALKNRIKLVFKYFQWKSEIKNIVAEGNEVIIKYIVNITHDGDYLGFPPTHKTIPLLAFHHFTFKEGKIYTIDFLHDYLKFLTQVGLALIEENNTAKIQTYMENLKRLNLLPGKIKL